MKMIYPLEGVVEMLSRSPGTSVGRDQSPEQVNRRQSRPIGHGVAVRQLTGPNRFGRELVVEP